MMTKFLAKIMGYSGFWWDKDGRKWYAHHPRHTHLEDERIPVEAGYLLRELWWKAEVLSWPFYRLWGLILWLTRNQPNEWGQCPWCGFGKDDWEWFMYKEPWFECTNGGTYYLPGEPTVHWAEGVQTCPKCWYKWWVSDSD